MPFTRQRLRILPVVLNLKPRSTLEYIEKVFDSGYCGVFSLSPLCTQL